MKRENLMNNSTKEISPVSIKSTTASVKEKTIPGSINIEALSCLVKRVMGEKYGSLISFQKLSSSEPGVDEFSISNSSDGITISATSSSAASNGLDYYIKHQLGCYVGPMTKNMDLPEILPSLDKPIQQKGRFLYRYLMNYCTYGYTFPFWQWEQWEPFLDWVALSGCNLFLNPIGTETVYRDMLLSLGYSQKSIEKFLAGPAFLPWQWMMNMTSWGGPIPEGRFEKQVVLANKINERLTSLGIGIILPGYSGIVPNDFKDYYPDSSPINQGLWEGFLRPSLILHDDLNFEKVSDLFYKTQKTLLGSTTSHFYSTDPFHEGGSTEGIDTTAYAKSIMDAMLRSDDKAIWFFQGWQDNPRREMLEVLPVEHILIANLLSEQNINGGDNFGNSPWLYCTINNFGGQRYLRGNVKNFLLRPFDSVNDLDQTIAGIGIAPEAVTTGEVFFDIFSDISICEKKPDLNNWIGEYNTYRYGKQNDALTKAWILLIDKIYLSDIPKSPIESALCARPSLTVDCVVGSVANLYMTDTSALKESAGLFYSVFDEYCNNEPFCFDITDIFRQIISNLGWVHIKEIQSSYKEKNIEKFEQTSKKFLSLFDIQDELLSNNSHTMLGTWLKYARDSGETDYEKSIYEFNARTIITLWGHREGQDSLHDYAAREWNGMLSDFYKPRWEAFINHLRMSLTAGTVPEEIDFYTFEYIFTTLSKEYPSEPYGNLKDSLDKIRLLF